MSAIFDDAEFGRTFPEYTDFKTIVENEDKGAVISAFSRNRGTRVALKLIADIGSASSLAKFEADFDILYGLHHERLVEVYGEKDYRWVKMKKGGRIPHFFFSMVLYESDVERALISRRFDLCSRLQIVFQMLTGLSFLHAHNVAHRDIKPRNLFLETLTRAQREQFPHPVSTKIGDFDIAKSGRAVRSAAETMSDLGTPPYLAPERWNGTATQSTDWRPSDQYAAGVTIYQILSNGALPLDFSVVRGHDPMAYRAVHLNGPLLLLVIPERERRGVLESFPRIDRVLHKMMAVHAEDRYRNVAQAQTELESVLATYGLWPCPHSKSAGMPGM